MRRLLLSLSLSLILVSSLAASAAAAPGKRLVGKMKISAWDARKEVFFEQVQVWRQGCDLVYRLTYRRVKAHPLKLRLLLELDAGPASTATEWIVSSTDGKQSAEGKVATPGCWIKKARRLKKVNTEVLGVAPRRVAPDGREFLGKVTFNRWGSSGDVYYRHIQIWRKGCAIHYQFLYKRWNTHRRRLKLRLVLDAGTLKTDWHRSEKKGWREIVGVAETPGCWAARAKTLKSSGFESERY
jgi:hypothetical protein